MIRPLAAAASVASAALLLSGCAHVQTAQTDPAIPVRAVAASSHTFHSSVVLSGNLVAVRSVTLGADIGGRVTSAPFLVGDRVGAGETVATIDDSAARAAVAQAEGARNAADANVAVASAQLQQANARFALANVTAKRMNYLYAQGAISRQQFDQSQADLSTARAAIAQSQAAVGAASGAVAQSGGAVEAAAVPLAHATIGAPFSGVVTAKSVDVGAVVSPGAALYTIEDDRDLEVDLPVPEQTAAMLVPGTPVSVHVDALGRDVPGRVRAVVPSAQTTTHSADVRVGVAAQRGMLSGMYARVTIAQTPYRTLAVPRDALVVRAGQKGVFTLDGDRASFAPIETGASDASNVEVRGLQTGRRVLLGDLDRLTDRARVDVRW